MHIRTITPLFIAIFFVPGSLLAQPLADRVPRDVLIYVGWAGSATAVLAYTIWLRSYSGFVLPPVMNAHLLLFVLTVTVLVAVAVLALRGKPRTAVQ